MDRNSLDILLTKNEIHSNSTLDAALLGKFENSLLVIKLFIFLVLIVASVINKDLTFAEKSNLNDNKYIIRFIIENIIVGLACAAPFMYMKWMRDNQNATVFNMAILFIFSFFFMSLINILFQFSGFYSYIYGIKKVPEPQDSIKKGLIQSVLISNAIVIGVLIFQILFVSLMIKNTDIPAYGNNVIFWFIVEIIIFGIINALPTLLVSYNRINNINMSSLEIFGIAFVIFSIIHSVFQISGFYKHILGI
jgi:Na+-driven multidrug efflux pump